MTEYVIGQLIGAIMELHARYVTDCANLPDYSHINFTPEDVLAMRTNELRDDLTKLVKQYVG